MVQINIYFNGQLASAHLFLLAEDLSGARPAVETDTPSRE